MSINDFLISIANDINNNNLDLTDEDFYYMLKYLGIKKDVSLAQDIEIFYQDFLNSLNNSLIRYSKRDQKFGENITHHIAFYADEKADYLEAVKVYFPVKYEYLIGSLKTVFLYLIRNNIKASVKFYVKATNEAIVIRFYDKNEVVPFINYCNNSFALNELLEPLNPFIVDKFGIGMVSDDNTVDTYMGTLSKLLQEYFVLMKKTGTLLQVSDEDFLDFVIKRFNIEENNEVKFNINSVLNSLKVILNK